MKPHLLKTMTKALNETEDMFPGVDASVFDEHNTKPKDENSKEEVIKLEKQAHRLNTLVAYAWRELAQIQHFLEKNKAMKLGMVGPQDIEYRELPWLEKKYPSAHKRLHGYFVSSSSPIINEIPKYIAKFDQALKRNFMYNKMSVSIEAKLEDIYNKTDDYQE